MSEKLMVLMVSDEPRSIDFLGAPGKEAVSALIQRLEGKLHAAEPGGAARAKKAVALGELRRRTWVTRRGIHVDRMACAWLIRRFVDPDAELRFVDPKGFTPAPGELRFDMFEGEFTHEGDLCSFEVILRRTGIADPALAPIAEIIHDIDLRDAKFGREDTVGIERVINGIAMAHAEDEARLARASALFDDLYTYFRRKKT